MGSSLLQHDNAAPSPATGCVWQVFKTSALPALSALISSVLKDSNRILFVSIITSFLVER